MKLLQGIWSQIKSEKFFFRSHYKQGWAARQIACELQTWLKFIQVPKKLNYWFFCSSFFSIDFKICLYARRFDTSYCPHDIFWLHFANSSKLWENRMCQWTSCKFSVIKLLAYRHILKSIVKKLEEKNQKFSFSKLDLSLSVHMQSAVLLPPDKVIHNKLFIVSVLQMQVVSFFGSENWWQTREWTLSIGDPRWESLISYPV